MRPVKSRLGHPRPDSGFRLADYWVWCGSALRGDDGLFHMFASRIPKALAFSPHWLTHSEIVHAISDTPEGPYRFSDVALPPRDPAYWDGGATHNPTIHRWGGQYLLYYSGTTFSFPRPTPENPLKQFTEAFFEVNAAQRIGLAMADSPFGPWRRMDQPLLEPRPGQWDECSITNPAPLIEADGTTWLGYKSARDPKVHGWPKILKYGMARAPQPDGPFTRCCDEPIFRFEDPAIRIEDAFLWHEDGVYQMLLNDLTGKLTGEDHSGVHAWSEDGLRWQIADPPQAYSRKVEWADGSVTVQGSLERPQLLMQDGRPTHLICATANGPGHFNHATDTWNVVFPLAR